MKTIDVIRASGLVAVLLLAPHAGAAEKAKVWTFCADESQRCEFDGTHEVRYGANDTYVTKSATGGIDCNNATFGDPLYGVVKHCEVMGAKKVKPKGKWEKCADENQRCSFSGTRHVRYGANDTYVVKTVDDGVDCNNATFGDPIVGVVKQCEMLKPKVANSDKEGKGKWSKCADENQHCAFSGKRVVRYGADGKFVRKQMTGGVDCNNATFGDPNVGVVKRCDLLEEK